MEAKGRSFGNDLGCAAGERATAEKRSGAAGRPAVRWRPAMPGPALERLHRQLETRERELWRKIVEERNRMQDEAQSQLESVGDIVDRAFVTTQVTMERDLIDRCMTQLDEIARTRDRIANGEIGICVDCHEPIEGGRLKANPVASRCTECQMVREKEVWINAR
jgi:RNA polymerase-binding transcription factor